MTNCAVELRRYRHLLAISQAGGCPSAAVLQLIAPYMQYVYVKRLFGPEAFDPATGDRTPVYTEDRQLYRFDEKQRLNCTIGFLEHIWTTLTAAGYELDFQDYSPPLPRPTAYVEDWDNLAKRFEFRPRQDEIVATIAEFERGVIKAPPGVGKTELFGALGLLYPRARIGVVVPGRENVQKSVRRLTAYLPDIGQVGCGADRKRRVTVYSQDSLHHLEAGELDILLVDEGHRISADVSYEWLLKGLGHARLFVFTATPEGRADGTDIRLEAIAGKEIFAMEWREAESLGLVSPIEIHWHHVYSPMNPCAGLQGVTRKRWGIWRNETRNAVIAGAARAYDDATQVLVMVDTIEHAIYLQQHLPEFQLCYGNMETERLETYKRQGLVDETVAPLALQDRQRMMEAFMVQDLKKVISTHIWSTGVSFDALSILVRADARSASMITDEQLPGRTSRIHSASGKEKGIVHDFLDEFDEGFKRAAQGRGRNYRKRNWAQIYPGGVNLSAVR